MNKELKLCPFCGGSASVITKERYDDATENYFAIVCNNCYAKVPWCGKEKEAKKWWNRRANSGKDQ